MSCIIGGQYFSQILSEKYFNWEEEQTHVWSGFSGWCWKGVDKNVCLNGQKKVFLHALYKICNSVDGVLYFNPGVGLRL